MKRIAWWFRIVGGFYMLLALFNMYFVLTGNTELIRGTIPFPADETALTTFIHGWSAFAFEILAIATFMLWASRNPRYYIPAVWLLVWLEFWHGVVGDIYLLVNGYDLLSYTIFIAIHLLIIVTGVLFVRQAETQTA